MRLKSMMEKASSFGAKNDLFGAKNDHLWCQKAPPPGTKTSHAFQHGPWVGLVFSIAKWNATPICLKQLSVNQGTPRLPLPGGYKKS